VRRVSALCYIVCNSSRSDLNPNRLALGPVFGGDAQEATPDTARDDRAAGTSCGSASNGPTPGRNPNARDFSDPGDTSPTGSTTR
jgi:hypothetical protein